MLRNWLTLALSDDNPARAELGGDADLLGGQDRADLADEVQNFRPAAVLVPIVDRGTDPTVLLTKRTESLRTHSGQVSFPGGRIDPSDRDARHAALREAREEVGLRKKHVEIVGEMDLYKTGTGFQITPVVGVISPDFKPVLQESEVEAAFEVPLSFFLDVRNHQKQSAVWKGKRRLYYAMPYGDYFIWGATAAMLVNLSQIMRAVRERV